MNATPATIADFAAWLDGQQEQASTGMQTTEGEAFGTHCDLAIEVITARSMLLKFTAELREQASTSPCTCPAPQEIPNVLTRMAEAMEEQNKILTETKLAICSVSMRIEDLMGCL